MSDHRSTGGCTRCYLHEHATHVCVSGRGSADPIFMFVGGSPSKEDNLDGRAFVGKVGNKVDLLLDKVGIEQSLVRFEHAVRCICWEDPKTKKRTVTPKDKDAYPCAVHLDASIITYNPTIIVAMGNLALHALVPDAPSIGKARGRRFAVRIYPISNIREKVDKLLAVNGIDGTSLSLDDAVVTCRSLGASIPEPKEYTVLATWDPVSIFFEGGQKRETEILNDLSYLRTLLDNKSKEGMREGHVILKSIEEIKEKYEEIKQAYRSGETQYIVVDIESDRLSVFQEGASLLGFSICYSEGKAVFVPYNHPESPFYRDSLAQSAISALTQELLDEIPVCNHFLQFDVLWLRKFKMMVKKVHNCTYLSSWTLFNDTEDHDLETLATKYTKIKNHKGEMQRALKELIGLVFDEDGSEREPNMGDVDLALVAKYCNLDTESTYQLNDVFLRMMVEQGLDAAHFKYTIPCILPACDMTWSGIKYNVDLSGKIGEDYENKILGHYQKMLPFLQEADEILTQQQIEEWERKAKMAAKLGEKKPAKPKITRIEIPHPDDPSVKVQVPKLSSSQIKRIILFDILRLPSIKATDRDKDKEDDPSTDKEVLETLLLECTDLSDTKDVGDFYATRVDVLETLIQFNKDTTIYSRYISKLPNHVDANWVIHGMFGIGTTDTSRWNATNPSLHIIPKKGLVKTAFEPLDPDGLILLGDYSQNELKVIAMVSGDETMKEIFRQDGDIHAAVMELLGVDRKTSKATNFGIAFQESAAGLAARLKISKKAAQKIIDDWYDQFYGVKGWVAKQIQDSKHTSEVWTATGFRRLLNPAKMGKNAKARKHVNSPIQGPASNFGALALSIVHKRLSASAYKSTLFAFIHDALGSCVYPNELYGLACLKKKVMEQEVPQLIDFIDVPLRSDFEVGTTWGTLLGMKVLPNKTIQLSGKPSYFDLFWERVSRWVPQPELVSTEVVTNKDGEEEVVALVHFTN